MTGIKVEAELDYRGSGAFPLEFRRTYRSDIAFNERSNNANRTDFAPLGVGWSATYFQRLEIGSSANQAGVVARRPSGVSHVFRLIDGRYVSDADDLERVVPLLDVSGTTTGWQYTTAADEVETYDPSGRLLSIANRAGVVHTITYGSAEGISPASVADPFGNQLVFEYASGAVVPKLSSVTFPDGTHIAYVYDANENVTSVTYPDSTVRTHLYELATQSVNLLTGILDEANVRYSTFAYDGARASSTQHAGGVDRYTFSYNTDGSRVITDPLNTARTYGTSVVWSSRHNTSASALCPGCGESKANTYDTRGNRSTSTDFKNVQTTYEYDPTRPLETSRTEAFGTGKARTITRTWHAAFNLPTTITEPNRTTVMTHDAVGNVLTRSVTDTSVTPNVTRTWTYTYNASGQILTEDGPRTDVSDVTTYTYYPCATGFECGQLHTITNALGHVTTFNTYNAHGQPLTITDANGVVTTLAYDARQRVTSRQVGSETTSFVYWPTGLLKQVVLPDNSFLLYTYDDAHRLKKIEDGEGNRVEYTLDAMGNRTAESAFDPSNALARTRVQMFNALNQMSKQIGAAGTAAVTTTFGYDAEGNQSSIAAPMGRNTVNGFDELNRLKQITDPAAGVTQFDYDANNNLLSVTDPRGKVTAYTYTGFGDLKQQVSPDTGVTISTYDSGGNVETATDARNAVTTYTYDALNRVSSTAFRIGGSTDQTISYSYDTGANGAGRVTGASDSAHSMSWQYDAQGRTTSKSQTVGTVMQTATYGYTNGNQTSLTTPSGQNVTYSYVNGRIDSIAVNGVTLLSGVLYEPFGPVRLWNWGNGSLTARVYDDDGRVNLVDSKHQYAYGYDDASRITSATNSSNGNLDWVYGYDALDRITSAARTGENLVWTYDANGNRTSQTSGTTDTYTVSTTSNRLSSIAGGVNRTYSYDSAGNTTGYGNIAFAYSNRGRMKSATVGGVVTDYVYNALGQLVKKSGGGGTTTLFMYDESGHLLGEYTGAGALIQETVWFGDIPVATLRPNGGGVDIFYVHTDHLNTPRRVTRPSDNKMRWRWDPNPFTDSAVEQNPESLGTFVYNLRLPGQVHMGETGLRYNYFRDYDPSTGRYVESDPIGLAGGINTYAYVDGNPISRVDPQGLMGFGGGGTANHPVTSGSVGVYVRCGSLPAVMGGSSGGVHCEVVATCKKTGETVAFGIGGGGEGVWDRLFGGKTPPKYSGSAPAAPPAGISQYTASCGKDGDCGCEALECLKKAHQSNQPAPYYALKQNSNSYAHALLGQCGCSFQGAPGAIAW